MTRIIDISLVPVNKVTGRDEDNIKVLSLIIFERAIHF